MPSELEAQCQHPDVLSQLLEQGFTLAQARHYLEVTEPSDVFPQSVPKHPISQPSNKKPFPHEESKRCIEN
jgi:hypothetical protein